MPADPIPDRLRFGDLELDVRAREIFDGNERRRLQEKPFEVLLALLERPGEVVLREELRDRLWPDQIVEFDNNLNTALTKLRRALGDDPSSPRYVETVPKRGYRLLAPVTASDDRGSLPQVRARRATTWLLVAGLGLAGLGTIVLLRASGPASPPSPPDAETVSRVDDTPVVPVRESLVVVLPFESGGPSPSDTLLADAFTDELITRLAARLPPEVGVIAHTSSRRYAGAAIDLRRLQEELGADFAVEGRVVTTADEVRVTARFVDVRDQAHLWAHSLERNATAWYTLHDDVAERIATALSRQLRPTPPGAAVVAEVSPEAWRLYLGARHRLRHSEQLQTETAAIVGDLQRAIALEPDFALAWSALAEAHYREPGPPAERLAVARDAAERAIALDGGLAEPYHRLASISLYHDWDWTEAARHLDRASELAPSLATIHHSRAAWYATQGRHDEALLEIDRALGLDPLSVVLHADAGWYLYVARRYREAIDRCQEAIALEPDHRGGNSYLFRSLLALGERDDAAIVARRLLRIEGATEAATARAEGGTEAAIAELIQHRVSRLRARAAQRVASPGQLALALLDADEPRAALEQLRSGADLRWGWIYPFLRVYPGIDPVRGLPELEELTLEVGIPTTG